MIDIYVDQSVAGMPDATGHLGHLVDSGHRVIVVGEGLPAFLEGLPGLQAAQAIPDSVAPGSWHVSSDPMMCANRIPGLQTLLVGPRLAPSPRPGPRCDAEARDAASAVLEILGRDVMG